MKKLLVFLQGDLKNITRDKMLFFILLSPLIMVVPFKIIISVAEKILWEQFTFSLVSHYPFVMAFIVMLIPLTLGTLVGFMILEERDQGILAYLSITPLSRIKYLIYKLFSVAVISIMASIFALYVLELVEVKLLVLLPIFLMTALEAPMLALVIGAFADNKVEGFALAKGSGLFFFAPLVGYLLETNWRYLAGVFPTFWVGEVVTTVYSNFSFYLLKLGIGFVVHLLFVYWLLQKFKNRVD